MPFDQIILQFRLIINGIAIKVKKRKNDVSMRAINVRIPVCIDLFLTTKASNKQISVKSGMTPGH